MWWSLTFLLVALFLTIKERNSQADTTCGSLFTSSLQSSPLASLSHEGTHLNLSLNLSSTCLQSHMIGRENTSPSQSMSLAYRSVWRRTGIACGSRRGLHLIPFLPFSCCVPLSVHCPVSVYYFFCLVWSYVDCSYLNKRKKP